MWKVGTKESARILKSELELFKQGLASSVPANININININWININFQLLWDDQDQGPEGFSQ